MFSIHVLKTQAAFHGDEFGVHLKNPDLYACLIKLYLFFYTIISFIKFINSSCINHNFITTERQKNIMENLRIRSYTIIDTL